MKLTLIDKKTKQETTMINVVELSHTHSFKSLLVVVEASGLGYVFDLNEHWFIIKP